MKLPDFPDFAYFLGSVYFTLFRHCEEGVSPTRQSSKFNGFDWIASLRSQ
jgi:hypothetical protein